MFAIPKEELLSIVSGRELLPSESNVYQVNNVVINTKEVKENDLFIAIIGERHDAHMFIKEALEKGASIIIVSHLNFPLPDDQRSKIIIVEDTFKTLYKLAEFKRNKAITKLVLVTGSVGKTTSKEMLYFAYKNILKSYKNHMNLNNHFGLPLTLASAPFNYDINFLEVGTDRPGYLLPLAKLARPDIAIITNLGTAHLANYQSFEKLVDEKAEICKAMNKDGVLLLNIDNEQYSSYLLNKVHDLSVRVITYGLSKLADITLSSYDYVSGDCTLTYKGESITYKIGVKGEHYAINSLLVWGVFFLLREEDNFSNLNIDTIKKNLLEFSPVLRRGNFISLELLGTPITFLDDTYNSSPESVIALLKTLSFYKEYKRKILCLGDMLEVGKNQNEVHLSLTDNILESDIDILFTIGNHTKVIHEASQNITKKHFDDLDSLKKEISSIAKDGDLFILKASNSINLHKVINMFA